MREDISQDLFKAIRKAGSQKAFAKKHGLSQSYISDVVHARRGISTKLARILGYEKRYYYWKPVTFK